MLGFDYGERRLGVAVGQTVTRSAEALVTLPMRDGHPDWTRLAALIAEWRPTRLVLGMPGTDDGGPHAKAPAIERFARRLAGRYRLPVAFVDERLSSYAAAEDPQSRRLGVDAVAARFILETWLADSQG